MSESTLVFVSYRRVDADADAQWLAETLKREFGEEQVFVDVHDIEGGEDFQQTIEATLARAKALLAVIGPKWLFAQDETTGERRIGQHHDWVRRELRLAFDLNVEVIPVLVGGASMPDTGSRLPSDIEQLTKHNAMKIRRDSRPDDQQRVAQRLVDLGLRRVEPECGEKVQELRRRLLTAVTRPALERIRDEVIALLKEYPRSADVLGLQRQTERALEHSLDKATRQAA